MSIDIGPKHPTKASSNDLDTNHKVRFSPETIDIKISLSENVYQVARLVCQMEFNLDWDAYLSELVRQDAYSLKNGDRNILKDYATKMLSKEP